METTEIITEEVTEVLNNETMSSEGISTGIKAVAGIGAAALCGVLIYRYAVRPIMAKIKAKKAEASEDTTEEETEAESGEETSENNT